MAGVFDGTITCKCWWHRYRAFPFVSNWYPNGFFHLNHCVPNTGSRAAWALYNVFSSRGVWGYICFTELLALDKVHLQKNKWKTFYVYHCFCSIYLFYNRYRRYGPPLSLSWSTCLDNHCFFGVPAFAVSNSASGAMISVPPNKCGELLKVVRKDGLPKLKGFALKSTLCLETHIYVRETLFSTIKGSHNKKQKSNGRWNTSP